MNGRASRPEVSELIKSNHNKLLFDQCKSYGQFLKLFILIKYILISGSLMFSWENCSTHRKDMAFNETHAHERSKRTPS